MLTASHQNVHSDLTDCPESVRVSSNITQDVFMLSGTANQSLGSPVSSDSVLSEDFLKVPSKAQLDKESQLQTTANKGNEM